MTRKLCDSIVTKQTRSNEKQYWERDGMFLLLLLFGANFTHLLLVVVVRRRWGGRLNVPHGHSLGDRDTSPWSRAALFDCFHLDKSVFGGHILNIRRPHSVQAGPEWDISTWSVRVLEVQLLLEFVGSENVRLSGARERGPGACLLEARRTGHTGVTVSVVRLRRRRRGCFGSFES